MAGANSGDTEPIGSDGSPGSFSPATENPKHVSAMADAESGDPERTDADASLGNAGESSALVRPSRYELQKLRDWKSFRRYLNNHEPPLSLPTCSGADVVEFLKHLDQVGKTKIHLTGCAFFGHPKPPAPCDCPLKQSWGNLDSLVYRLRALYEEKGCNPGSNPFGTTDVQAYLREVRQYQAKARGIDYGKKRKQPLPALPAAPEGGATDSSDPSCTSHSNYIYGYATGGAMIPKTQNQFMPNRKDLGQYVPIWIRPPDLPIQYWASTMLNSIPNKVGTQEKASEEACEAPDPEEEHTPTVRQNAKERISTGETPKGILKKTRPRPDTGSQRSDPQRPPQTNEVIELPVAVIAPICASGIDGSRVFSWKDDKVASLIISKIQLHIGSTELGYPIINKERFNTELEALEQKGEKWSNPWFLSLLDDTLRGLPRPLRGSEVKVNRPYECRKVRWLDPVETVLGKIDV